MSTTPTIIPEGVVDLILADPNLSLQHRASELILLKELERNGRNGWVEVTQTRLRDLTGIRTPHTARLLNSSLVRSGRWTIRTGIGPFNTRYTFVSPVELTPARKGDQ